MLSRELDMLILLPRTRLTTRNCQPNHNKSNDMITSPCLLCVSGALIAIPKLPGIFLRDQRVIGSGGGPRHFPACQMGNRVMGRSQAFCRVTNMY